MKRTVFQRTLCIIISMALLLSYLPGGLLSISAATSAISTVADPETLTRPQAVYDNNTLNAGKITVGKSVSTTDVTVNGQTVSLSDPENFLITISQSAQVMGLTTQSNVPVDVVFVLDTSGSMWVETDMVGPKADGSTGTMNRSEAMIKIVNDTIESLMALNSENRVGVVAFSGHNLGVYNTAGRADNDAAFELSPLASYSGAAATNHLTYGTGTVNWAGTVPTVHGRDAAGNVGTTERYTIGGATNIQAGIAKGAQMLMNASLTENNTRIPFLIVLSDGAPTVSSSNDNWWEPDQQRNQGNYTYANGNDPVEGNSFLTLLTAAYYTAKVSAHYTQFSGKENNLNVFTIGYGLDTQTTDYEIQMSEMTLNPAAELLSASGNFYQSDIEDAWASYVAGEDFTIQVGPPNGYTQSSTITHDGLYYFYNQETTVTYNRYQQSSLTNRQPNDVKYNETWVDVGNSVTYCDNIIEDIIVSGTLTDLAYNDEYYEAENASQLETIFGDLLTLINRKTISSPTKVTTGDHNFDGYINFYDPIGEYMEVKDMKGIVADGFFYQGASFAEKLSRYGTADADAEFDALLEDVILTRLHLSNSTVDFAAFAQQVLASENQAYYNGPNDYDNSIVWWGNAYNSGEEDMQVQTIGFADNDTIDYIIEQRAAGNIPEGADYVVRSYFFYGEAGGTNPNPDHTYLYFMVQVRRELTSPYNQTVVISAPASLLSMEKVLIHESFDDNGDPVYTVTVEHQDPARVVYEVGLWDSITPENVDLIVSSEYADEAVNGTGSVNYDAVTGTYHFFTNDWDRTQSPDSHHRGMAKATFDAAADNAFYTYQVDTLLVDANGAPVTSNPVGSVAYYVREYYEWEDNDLDGTFNAVKKTALIEVDLPDNANLLEIDGQWYIPKGTYTGATLVVNGDDTLKTENVTGTSSIVAHPHRTGDSTNSHYTVFLGNNGMLTLVADPYEPVKTVSVNLSDTAVRITDDNGKAVQVGDVLTYTVEVKNVLPYSTDITVSDFIPMGTAFVDESAGQDATGAFIVPNSNSVLTWVLEDVPAGQTRTVSFKVTVQNSALNQNLVPGTINNTAQVIIGNNPSISTNTVYNPPYGKTVTDLSGTDINGTGGYKVGDILVFHIRVTNSAVDANGNPIPANITITDEIPAGTVFVEHSAGTDANGQYIAPNADNVLTWVLEDVPAAATRTVSFQVRITAAVKDTQSGQQPVDGEIEVPNTAYINVENNPQFTTNTTVNFVDVGELIINKTVVADSADYNGKAFDIYLTETTGLLDGTYVLARDGAMETVTFTNGNATVSIHHGESLTIQGLPAGTVITLQEASYPGWTPAYNTTSVTVPAGSATTVSTVSITNTYSTVPVVVTLHGQKNLTGLNMDNASTFGFIAVPSEDNPEVGDPLSGEVTVKNTGAYDFAFSPKVFTKPGDYTYTIYEVDGGVLGVTYDKTRYTLEVFVRDTGLGTLTATAQLNGQPFDMDNEKIIFENTYNPVDTQLEILAQKVLNGRNLIAGEFTFQITDGTNTYYGVNDASGNIIFETIHYAVAGTYTYTMSEIIPADTGNTMTYDRSLHTVVVEVKDEGGALVASVTVDGQSVGVRNNVLLSGVVFSNSFAPDDVPLVLNASKVLWVYNVATGTYDAAVPEAGQFHFQITNASGNTVSTGTSDSNGKIVFNAIYFSVDMLKDVEAVNGVKNATFTYYISEVVPTLAADPNMLYDSVARAVQVSLSYNINTGVLTVGVNGDDDGNVDLDSVVFNNYSNPDSVTVRPVGFKTTVGHNLPAGLSFSFAVVPVDATEDAAIGTSDFTVGGSDSEIHNITFTSSVYTHESLGNQESAVYRYWIMESNAGAGNNGVTYDMTRYLYQVTLSRNEFGRLVATEKYFMLREGGSAANAEDYTVEVTGSEVTFTNTYAAQAHINLTANKVLSGRSTGLAAGEFSFVLHRLDANGKLVSGSEITGYNSAIGEIHFATLNYSNAMLDDAYKHTDGAFYFSYLMSEIKPVDTPVPGVTYDSALYVVTIKVTQNNVTGMEAVLAGVSLAEYEAVDGTYRPGTAVSGFSANGNTNVSFSNVYQITEGDTVRFQVSKILEGRDLRAGEFEFGLYLNDRLVDVATNDANGIISFSRTIPATVTLGIYEMVIKELPGTASGVTYSSQEYTFYLKVEDNNSGKIHASILLTKDGAAETEVNGVVDLTDNFVFRNTYEAHDTTYTPVGSKVLSGRSMISGEFSFLAQLVWNDAAVANGATYHGVNDANGDILFNSITFSDQGTYIYKITEVKGSTPGMGYDTRAYYLKVTVTDDMDGKLHASAKYYTDEACTDEVAQVVFHNVHTPASVPVQLEATKLLTGRPLAAEEFSFLVYPKDSTNYVATGSNDATGNILFSTFSISAQDMMDNEGNLEASKTFTYVIVESDNRLPGVRYAGPVEITVTVTNINGVFNAVVNYPTEGIVFANTYTPDPVSVPVVAIKNLTGKKINNGEFTFELKDASGNVLQSKTNDAYGVISFDDLQFTAEDMVDSDGNKVMTKTFVYTLSERIPDSAVKQSDGRYVLDGMTYDANVYTIIVNVTDNGQGNLHATTAYRSSNGSAALLSFENSYTPAELLVDIEATKTIVDSDGYSLTGGNFPLDAFRFQLLDVNGKLIAETSSKADGTISFPALRLTAAGEYRFTVRELTSNKTGYSTDSTEWCVHITVSYNADTGKLYESGRYIHQTSVTHNDPVMLQNAEQIEFVNVYRPADVSFVIQGLKQLSGRPLKEHEFTFYMVDNATGLIAAESRNHGNGQISFSLSYDRAGTYTYTVFEEIPAESPYLGVTYSRETFTVTVEVIDNGSGVLTAKVNSIIANGTVDLTESVIFYNTYEPGSGKAVVEAWKHLEGKALTEGKYTFQLVNVDDPADRYTATNDASGRIVFGDELVYSASDMVVDGQKVMEKVFTYVLTEIKGNEPGVTYDESTYFVSVTVTDDGYGNLVTSVQYSDSDHLPVSLPIFRNTYEAKPVHYTPVVHKVFERNEGEMRTFDFVLSGEGFETQIKHNDEFGDVTFDRLTFTQVGTYFITIVERSNAEMTDIRWDTNVYTLKIVVEDNTEKGELEITSLTITSLTGSDDLIFRNVHEDLITHKDVFLDGGTMLSVDGEAVKVGDILTYAVTYKNYSGLPADITITDAIPAYTTYVSGSADNDGTYADGILTWHFADVAPNEEVTVTFQVKVTGANVTIENQAHVLEGENTYKTNLVTNLVPVDDVQKDVFQASEPTVSIDGEAVKVGDVLLYTITYKNSYESEAEVTITDAVPEHTAYVPGTADNDGTYANGVLTWHVYLGAGESITVSFQVKVVDQNVCIENQATALEGSNALETNTVTNDVPVDNAKKDVFSASEPAVSIDGEAVKVGDTLLYTITYKNSFEAEADVTIIDTIPEHTVYVAGSADNDGTYTDGVLTWNVHLDAGQSFTVSFQVEVVGQNVTIENQATVLEGDNELVTNVVTNDVPVDEVEKDVFHASDPTISINGQNVKVGDILVYTITYSNSHEAAADVTITDEIPAYTTYVEGSADNGAIYSNGILTWELHLEAGQSLTVSFKVEVTGSNVTLSNQAEVLEGSNTYKTNTVTNPVPEDVFVKDVAHAYTPTVSIDGQTVEVGDTLVYTITYKNSFEAAADVTITDKIPEHTTYLEGSADNGAIYADGVLTWNVHLDAGQSITVSFQIKVIGSNVVIENQATALEGENELQTNTVTVTVPDPIPVTGDDFTLIVALSLMGLSSIAMWTMLAYVQKTRKKNSFKQ